MLCLKMILNMIFLTKTYNEHDFLAWYLSDVPYCLGTSTERLVEFQNEIARKSSSGPSLLDNYFLFENYNNMIFGLKMSVDGF